MATQIAPGRDESAQAAPREPLAIRGGAYPVAAALAVLRLHLRHLGGRHRRTVRRTAARRAVRPS